MNEGSRDNRGEVKETRGLQALSHAAPRASIVTRRPLPATAAAGPRRLLSSPAPGATAGGVQSASHVQGQLHRGKKEEGKERRLWPYLKAAKQQFFNVVVATLAIVMAVKMVEGKGARVALEEEIAELERREGVLLRALSDESWAEDVAKRVSAGGGKEAMVKEISNVVKFSMLDKESAELEAMKAAALKVAREGGGAAVGEDGGVFSSTAAGDTPRKGTEASQPASSRMM
eukprot:g15923.t1